MGLGGAHCTFGRLSERDFVQYVLHCNKNHIIWLQVKCPECRAEHRIPYQGVQGYPTNVTLQRFLELHIEITGELPDPTSGQVMKRCNVCSEKAYCTHCVHCDKDICPDCKGAHMDILRREISRINNQVCNFSYFIFLIITFHFINRFKKLDHKNDYNKC